MSRYERGVTPLGDVTVLRRFARALAISPGEFGLAVTDHLRTWAVLVDGAEHQLGLIRAESARRGRRSRRRTRP
jgi:hypothetical protein